MSESPEYVLDLIIDKIMDCERTRREIQNAMALRAMKGLESIFTPDQSATKGITLDQTRSLEAISDEIENVLPRLFDITSSSLGFLDQLLGMVKK